MLDELLAPIKWTDEQVLRQYTKYPIKIENEKGIDKFDLAAKYNKVAKWFYVTCSVTNFGLKNILGGIFNAALAKINFEEEKDVKDFRAVEELEARSKVKIQEVEILKKSSQIIRLPMMGTGLMIASFGMSGIYNSFNEKNITEIVENVNFISNGYALFAWSSAIYIRGSDPKLLDKQPSWKKVMNYFKEKVSPEPVPVPVEYKTIEDQI